MNYLAGTDDGLYGPRGARLPGHRVSALAADGSRWAVVDGNRIFTNREDRWEPVAELAGLRAHCLLATPDDLLVGTSEARLLRLKGEGFEPLKGFDETQGRADWYTPWGGPPDTRSLSRSTDGTLYANVHVGGILRSTDRGRTWWPTLDIDADVHQVLAHPARPKWVVAATARGLAVSRDGGDTWRFRSEDLHHRYCRAVAIVDGVVLVSASAGPSGGRAAVYRGDLEGERLERCRAGLPDWLPDNVDTHCLVASGPVALFGTTEGALYRSDDAGRSWRPVADRLAPVRCVALEP